MPSGAKKRKAARRKKEMGTSNNNNPENLSHVGVEEMMKKREDTSGVRSNARDSEIVVYSVITSTNKAATHQNGGILINKVLKPKDDLSIKLVEPVGLVVCGGSSSGSSVSGDECHDIRKDVDVIESGPKMSYINNAAILKTESQRQVDIIVQDDQERAVASGVNAEHKELSTASKCSETQPLISSAPKPVETSSWKSCCGIFELITGSDR